MTYSYSQFRQAIGEARQSVSQGDAAGGLSIIRGAVAQARDAASAGKKATQKSSKPASTAARSDDAPASSKKSSADIGREQVLAKAGDTVPIVFGKRVSDVGGVWVQPPLLKQGSYGLEGQFLYAISQGDMAASPQTYRTFVGNQIIDFLPGTTASVSHFFASAATMAASPNTCPITGGKIFCDTEARFYLETSLDGRKGISYVPNLEYYFQVAARKIGTGDLTNTVRTYDGTAFTIKEVETGIDRTSDYWSLRGQTPSSQTYIVGQNLDSSATMAAMEKDTSLLGTWFPGISNYWQTLYGADGPVAFIYENDATINTQYDTGSAATDDTFAGDIYEYGLSPVADPTSYPSSYDFTVFSDITFLVVEGNIYDESDLTTEYKTTVRQLSVFYDQGIKVALYSAGTPGTTGASNQFVDLAMFLFELIKRLDPASTASIATPIDTSNLQTLATFNTNIGTHFNGIIEQSMNVIEYISTMAPFFLLSFISSNGQYSLQPLLPITAGNQIDTTALTPAATFTEDDIVPGSFSKEYRPADERRDIVASMVWRETTQISIGIQRTTTVRYPATASDAPVEQFDMTDCCTSAAHATLFGKYILASRKYATHSIAFNVPLLTTSLIPTQIIKVQRQRITSTGDNRTEIEWYQVTDIKHSTEGISTISATHFPVDGSNVAEVSDDVVNGTFTVV